MRRLALVSALAGAALIGLCGQSSYDVWHQPDGTGILGQVIYCSTGSPRQALPCGVKTSPFWVMSMPFTRLHRDPIQLSGLGPVPKSFPINRPDAATTYRIVVLCNVPIRIMGAMTATEQVSDTTGTAYLPLTETTMGTSKPLFISAKTIGTPDGDCSADMHYGVGGG